MSSGWMVSLNLIHLSTWVLLEHKMFEWLINYWCAACIQTRDLQVCFECRDGQVCPIPIRDVQRTPKHFALDFIVSLLCQEGKQAIKSKEGAIKCCKEKTTSRQMSGVTFHFKSFSMKTSQVPVNTGGLVRFELEQKI